MSVICKNILNKLNYFPKYSNLLNSKLNFAPLVLNYSNSQLKSIDYDEKTEKDITKNVLKKVNEDKSTSRLFAVVQICGKQFKITTDDLIVIEGYWPPNVGDKISLDKVLCAGGLNFSLIGTPLVQPGLVNIHATVIEKNLSHTRTHFRKKRRKQYMRINFYRAERTVLRINDIGIGRLKDT